jgi:group I intron endonuclease
MKEKTYIYGLVEPNTNELRYVGKTVDINRRHRRHITEVNLHDSHKDRWIRKLLKSNHVPEIIVIDLVETNEWQYWEIFYIEYFKFLGCNLTNGTKGGDQPPSTKGRKHSETSRLKMSKSKKGKPIPHLNNGKERSLSHRKNLSLSLKGRTSPNKGLTLSDERKKLLSEGHNKEKRKIVQLTKSGEYIETWFGINETEKKLKIRHISECCNGKCKTAGGFKWVYYEEYER